MPNSSNDDNRRSDENPNSTKNDNVEEAEDVDVNVNILSRRDDVDKQGIVISFMRT